MKRKLNNQILEAIHRGVQLALDDYEDELQPNKKVGNYQQDQSKTKLFLNFVDLGLPSKTLWYKYNLGVDPLTASEPEDWYGNFYAWGELESKEEYSRSNYKHATFLYMNGKSLYTPTKYTKRSDSEILLPEDDIAYKELRSLGDVHIPTAKQFEELIIYTRPLYLVSSGEFGNLHGWIMQSIINGKHIFLPAAGYITEKTHARIHENWDTLEYWTSNRSQTDEWDAISFSFGQATKKLRVHRANKWLGMPIRPVLDKY